MPTYDYRCISCGQTFEYFQSMKDEPLTHCLCGKNGKVERLISPGAGFIFKGSGFYITDYRSKDYQQKAKSEHNGSTADSTKTSSNDSSASTTKTTTSKSTD
ncbi:MAG: zinc ribbon domain-containing protein [Gemmatimonadetes bacterium]|nr:MAG: zinc ribbon domain-containing protein [Gemmatimonadota bacterium]